MSRVFAVLGAVVFLVTAAVVYFWHMQNADQTVQFHLDLTRTIGAWEMREPMPATTGIGLAFGSGYLLAALMFGGWGLGLRRRLRLAERAAMFASDR